MDVNEYQQYVRDGASEKYKDLKFAALALVGEVGELCDVIKKAAIYTDHLTYLDSKSRLKDEAGDVMWQYFALLNTLGLTFQEVAEYNVKKLNARHGGATLDKTGGIR